MKKIDVSIEIPAVVGPGSQPADSDGAQMDFMNLPSGMTTFESPIVPEPEEIIGMEAAVAFADKICRDMAGYRIGDHNLVYELSDLDTRNRQFMNQLLGDGEVSVLCGGALNAQIQESVLAGLWRVHYLDEKQQIMRDTMEIGAIPGLVGDMTFAGAAQNVDVGALEIPETVYNAPPLLAEIHDKLPQYQPAGEPHIINLSLLPHTEEDIKFLSSALGVGPNVILSRGYGNCRISSTATQNVWWVQYFNSQDTLILNTLEISSVPEVACASQEDIDDSAARLDEILSIYR